MFDPRSTISARIAKVARSGRSGVFRRVICQSILLLFQFVTVRSHCNFVAARPDGTWCPPRRTFSGRLSGETRLYNLLSALLLAFSLFIVLNGCSAKSEKTPDENGRLKVTVTTGMLADAVRNIGGERFEVTALMGPGVDPHLFKASEGDVARLAGSDIIVYSGLHLEGKMVDVFGKMARRKPVIAAAELLPEERLTSPPEFKGMHDPHVWFNLDLWAALVGRLGAALGEVDSVHRAEYVNNADAYAAEIRALHGEVKKQVATIPAERRVLITAHDAFGYFGAAYDIEVRGLQGISTVAEYGLMDLTNLVDFIVERELKAIFVESSISPRSIEAVLSGVRARGHEIDIGGILYSDALGEAGTPEGNYLGMVRYNVNTIVNSLR